MTPETQETYRLLLLPLRTICRRTGKPEASAILEATRFLDPFASDRSLPRPLRHYLQRRNYGRALEWVEIAENGEDPEAVWGERH